MDAKENRFAFRASNEVGDFIRYIAKQTGWTESEVIRFAIGFWMMSVKSGFFAALGTSDYRPHIENINLSSRDVIPMGDIKALVALSGKYAAGNAPAPSESPNTDVPPEPKFVEPDEIKEDEEEKREAEIKKGWRRGKGR